MNRRDLILRLTNRLAQSHGLTQVQIHTVLDEAIREMAEALVQGESLEFRNFGIFEVKTVKGRLGRNPRQPERTVKIPPHRTVRFKPGQTLKKRLQNPQA